jgi:putative endopeptidase
MWSAISRRRPRRAERLMANLLKAYKQAIEDATWLAAPTRREALAKLSRIRLKIGYPDRWRDYRNLAIAKDDLFGNVMRGRAFDNQNRMTRVGGPLDSHELKVRDNYLRQWLLTLPHSP